MTSHDSINAEHPVLNQQLEMLLAILEDEFEPGKTILDLGYGSGLFEAMIFERIPHAQIVGVETSRELAAQAEERLKPYPFRFIPVRYDLTELAAILGPTSPLPRQHYQIVFSVQGLNQLTPEQLQGAYLTIYDILDPGGLLLLLDRAAVSTPRLRRAYQSLRRLLERQHNITIRENNADPLRPTVEHSDLLSSVDDHLRWLRDASFEPACLHLYADLALIAARKI